ncbi:MAG TPA: hypothetical protein H9861_05325 [Candidatus Ligilactobacillus excrementigallinarum]|uniref:Uncharacterized protein n=1 Tax=Candidatus Ligilactobacillus excrementigallinarum TaxID=2838641 RepID=A0A9D1UXL3_9LACO|nr:hypothetical protein [Candidatus Ligilactobacillus excrementigallinarum]
MKEQKLGNLAEEIVKYQEKYHLTDAELALTSHFSVERIHAIKAGQVQISPQEYDELQELLADEEPVTNDDQE